MPYNVAGMYEIQNQIGSGGGGIVYLGRHIRLDKAVVLKEDKRQLSIGADALKREVDLLKNLSHTFIPQVYDFVQENDSVYTVMDYIDGRSLDKIIADGIIPPQKEVIRWACQLLQALVYLHGRPPYGILHGDIKPANIMLRSNGDICLIDFNIALALGEEGAVKVGFSRGYASPEHYGADYIKSNIAGAAVGSASTWRSRLRKGNRKDADPDKTQIISSDSDPDKTLLLGSFPFGGSKTGGKNEVLLDMRSDIYSLGATLYHLISGQRPPQDARDVEPLGESVCNREVSRIIQKAMMPQPGKRYQTAQEMLDAFRNLYKTDARTVRHKKRIAASAVFIGTMFLGGGVCAFLGMRQLKQVQESIAMSEYAQNTLVNGDAYGAVMQSLDALETEYTPEAQKALTDALGVYDLSDGFKPLERISLPSAPFDMSVSPQNTRLAVVYAYEMAVYELESREQIAVCPINKSALSDAVFLDEDNIIYAGKDGVTVYNLSKNEVQWIADKATSLVVSGNGRIAAAVNKDSGYADLYDTDTGEKIAVCDFHNRHMHIPANDIFADVGNSVFALNEDGSLLAVSFSDGSLSVFDIYDPENELILTEENEGFNYSGGFSGKYFAFSYDDSKSSLFALIDAKEGVYIGGLESKDHFTVEADASGIYIANANLLESVELAGFEEKVLAYAVSGNITSYSVGDSYILVANDDNSFAFYDSGANLLMSENCGEHCDFVRMAGEYAVIANRTQKDMWLMKLENHSEAQLLSYDARYAHDEARISHDGNTAMLFSYQGFRVYDMNGEVLADTELMDAEQVYDQQFIRENNASYLEVTWYDGIVRDYSAADGSLISERKTEAPSKDLYEEFYTEKYRFASSLHDAPEVYDIKSGKYITSLEKDAYLTYVTQAGDYIITEYVSAQGDRYGFLLDDRLRKLAYLPGLCDVTDQNIFVFDYKSGDLRQCRLYSLQELTDLGETYNIN